MKEKIKNNVNLEHYLSLITLAVISVIVGICAAGIDTVFGKVLELVTEFRAEHTLYLIPLLPAVGLFVTFAYKKWGGESIKGMGLVIEAHDGKRNNIPLRTVPFAMTSTWLTHLAGGSVGREGVAVQMSCAISYNIANHLPIKKDKRILLVAGVAAGFAGLFRTPIAALFFALEIFDIGLLEIDSLLPAAVASFTASHMSGIFGMTKFSAHITTLVPFTGVNIIRIALLGVVCGLAGLLFSRSIKYIKRFLNKIMPNDYVRIAVSGAVIALMLLLCGNGRYSGASEEIVAAAVGKGGTVYTWDFIAKLLFTAVCVAAGFKGGEVAPLFAIGATLGAVFGAFIGLPPQLAAAMGYAAVFCSGTNTLISAIFIGAEIFGWQFFPYMIIVCIVSYFFNFNRSIYIQHTLKELIKNKAEV